MKRVIHLTRSYFLILLLIFLASCNSSGGGDGGNNNPVIINPAPSSLFVDAGTGGLIALSGSIDLQATVTENGLPPVSNPTYTWSKASGPGNVAFANPDSLQTNASFSQVGSYVLRLDATNSSDFANDTVNVTVNLLASGVGLASRPSNSTECIAPDEPPSVSNIQLEEAFPNLPALTNPVALYMAPNDSSYWYVVQQGGQVLRFENNPAVNSYTTFIDIDDGRLTDGGELGLLGMAFHPDYATNGYVYLSYTHYAWYANNETISRVSRFSLDGTGQSLDSGSEQILISLEQPEGNHNGGQIAFGPDGYLYIGFGDGGGGGDPYDNGQDPNTLHAAMLRVDVGDGSSATYAIPATNPFVSGGGRPEVYAYGLRNPWRWSFDKTTGDLWVGDVGQGAYEEIDIIVNGGNYGWNIMEGAHCYNAASCNQVGLVLPVAEYSHSMGMSVTGGYVYRGSDIAFMQGNYIYGDYVTGRIWMLDETGPGQYASTELLDTSYNIASFAEDHDGELYVVHRGGAIYQITGSSGGPGGQIPTQLSDWGCFDAADITSFSDSVIPYDINALLWSDDADKGRFIAIPDGTTVNRDSEGRLDFPVGSVIGKHFRLNGELIETRLLLHHQPPHGWKGYTYEWNDQGTDADLLTSAKNKDINGQEWHYPSQSECDACHTNVAGITLGPELIQMNRSFTYPATGQQANQLTTLESIGVLSSPNLTDDEKLASVYPIDDLAYSSELRSRSYLHSNCANCHQPGGPGGGNMDLRFLTSLEDARICNEAPLGDTLGLNNPVLVAPGDPERSILVLRMEDLGQHRMPPVGSGMIDTQAISVIRHWITNIDNCP
jgi:uncharacterized repeat protein (TIGR03806 family)